MVRHANTVASTAGTTIFAIMEVIVLSVPVAAMSITARHAKSATTMLQSAPNVRSIAVIVQRAGATTADYVSNVRLTPASTVRPAKSAVVK